MLLLLERQPILYADGDQWVGSKLRTRAFYPKHLYHYVYMNKLLNKWVGPSSVLSGNNHTHTQIPPDQTHQP